MCQILYNGSVEEQGIYNILRSHLLALGSNSGSGSAQITAQVWSKHPPLGSYCFDGSLRSIRVYELSAG